MNRRETEDDAVSLVLEHQEPGHPPFGTETAATIADTQVWIMDQNEHTTGCTISWVLETTPTMLTDHALMVRVHTAECPRTQEIVETLIPAMREGPPADVIPQHPLLYAPDEPDSPQPGACAFAAFDEYNECEPYIEVPVPDDAAAMVAGSDADPNVECAIALDEVTAGFGKQFQPVTVGLDGRRCVFAEPDRRLQIEFDIWTRPLGRKTAFPDATEAEFAGHRGYVSSTETHSARVATSMTPDEGGTISFEVRPGPRASGPLSPESVAAAETVLTEILRNHFS